MKAKVRLSEASPLVSVWMNVHFDNPNGYFGYFDEDQSESIAFRLDDLRNTFKGSYSDTFIDQLEAKIAQYGADPRWNRAFLVYGRSTDAKRGAIPEGYKKLKGVHASDGAFFLGWCEFQRNTPG